MWTHRGKCSTLTVTAACLQLVGLLWMEGRAGASGYFAPDATSRQRMHRAEPPAAVRSFYVTTVDVHILEWDALPM